MSADAQAGSGEPSLPVNQRRGAERLIAIQKFDRPQRHGGAGRRSYSGVKRHFFACMGRVSLRCAGLVEIVSRLEFVLIEVSESNTLRPRSGR